MPGSGIPQRIITNGWLTRKYTTYNNYTGVFKDANMAAYIGSAASPTHMPKLHGLPEIVVTGRANSGKSSLLNAVLGRNSLLQTSKKPGRTRLLNFYRVGAEPGKLVLVDSPGYGARGRPEWGELFDEYLRTRKELKRVYLLLNGKHLLKTSDHEMLKHLSEIIISQRERFSLQPIITKVDDIPPAEAERQIDSLRNSIKSATSFCMPPIVTSATMGLGIDTLRRNMEVACGLATLDKREEGTWRIGSNSSP